MFRTFRAILFFLIGFCTVAAAQQVDEQVLVLQPGWNLITFQVLPTDRSPSNVLSALRSEETNLPLYDANPNVSRLRAAYGLRSVQPNPNGKIDFAWDGFGLTAEVDATDIPVIDTKHENLSVGALTEIAFSKGYFVYVESILAGSRFKIEGAAAAGAEELSFDPPWSLVGFAIQEADHDTGIPSINVASVFRPGDFASVRRIIRWDSRNQRFGTYQVGDAELSEFQMLDRQSGYWVETTAAVKIRAELVLLAPADVDAAPLADPPVRIGAKWTPGPEDTEIGLPGSDPVFDTSETQSVVWIAAEKTVFNLPFYNRGGGILGWKAELLPFSGTPNGGAIALTDPAVIARVVRLERSRGLALAETSQLRLIIDRTHLPSGLYLFDLLVSTSSRQTRRLQVVVEARGLEGQWVGKATIQTVNGRTNAVPDVDLHVHLTQDSLAGSHLLRALIDSRETLLWPDDANLIGHYVEQPAGGFSERFSHRFILTGGVTVRPGDINRFPYDTFPLSVGQPGNNVRTETDPVTGLMFRTNSDGDRHYFGLPGRQSAADFRNPTPKFISRNVEFVGQLTGVEDGSPVLTGEYYEIVSGLLPQPIEIKGRFRLVRKADAPFRSDVSFGNTPEGGVSRPAHQPYNDVITVKSGLLLDRVVVIVAQDAPDRRHTLRLTAPDGTEIVLHNGDSVGPVEGVVFDSGRIPLDPLTVLKPPELRGATPIPSPETTGLTRYEFRLRESLASYVVRQPRQSLASLVGKTSGGDWTLRWQHSVTGKVQKLNGWSLLLYGSPVHSLSGRVLIEGDSGSNRFENVSLNVVGLNADLPDRFVTFDRKTGAFSISTVPGVRINVFASKPGYAQAGIDNLDNPKHPRGFRDGLEGFLPGDPGSDNLSITLRATNSRPTVFASTSYAKASSESGAVRLQNLTLAVNGTIPDDVQLSWEPNWDGERDPPRTLPPVTAGRSISVNLEIPETLFTPQNNYSVALKPRVFLGDLTKFVAMEEWIVVALDRKSSDIVLDQLYQLNGFGGEISYGGAADPTGQLAILAQKIGSTKVDIDRPPLINRTTNPSLEFDRDGAVSEDVDVHPRTFKITRAAGENWAYAEIQPTPDARLTELLPPRPGETPQYNDMELGIDGRDINAPREPVVIFSAIGGIASNLGGASTNGQIYISTGANPGPSNK